MEPRNATLTSRPLTPTTWSDFESLFRRSRGMQAGCWCIFYHRSGPTRVATEEQRPDRNRRDHQQLVEQGQAHGVLIYLGDQPVGWCQFGRKTEFPRIDAGRKYRALNPSVTAPVRWRITCFFVDRSIRHQGVARFALREALRGIQMEGGGVVEAYPATNDRAVATWFGSVSMFRREGFRVVVPFGQSNVLMQRDVRAISRRRDPVPPVARRPRKRGSSQSRRLGTAH